MATYVALLRGINVGRNRRIPMEDLRDLLRGLGHADARTWILSGNALFTSKRRGTTTLSAEIEKALEKRFGHDIAVVIRTRDELAAIIAANPLADAPADPSRFYVVFLDRDPAPARLKAIDPDAVAPDEFVLGDRVIYAWYRNGLQQSKLAGLLTDRGLSVTATARNWNTVTKLLSLADEMEKS